MQKLINDPDNYVDEMLDGMVSAYPERLTRVDDTKVLTRDSLIDDKVGIVTGGGSGHEPTHAGYIGDGMLDGAAAGEVFTSPTADELDTLAQACDTGEGVLCVVKNYEGDVMNFDTAAEMAEIEDVTVEQIVVDDDVAVEDSLYTSGRRGVCGTIFVHKAVGAKAAAGGSLEEVAAVGEKVIDNVGTMGMALTSCVTPAKGEETFDLGEDEIELGIGIHGEPGTERTDQLSAEEVGTHLTENVLDDLDPAAGTEVAVIVNGMGGTPLSELFIVNNAVQSTLEAHELDTWETMVGDYMTSLDMRGCSVTVCTVDDELKELFAAPADTPALTRAGDDE
ncbi:dihydroxyacetone kinase subunit DhaK [Haloquadratum walsbyi]|jgi:dihydroxyacetone kinase-like protein|uniref:Dihydroxyacetone kinase subunit DhaK n=1 Tax=Haloquadratum walsbyi (strain DSM 16854 / JCM 12705 / C23) TaxID=768065 RepID=G0LLJ3_HALWC|nr:dihydroxyacetone kinase subunit DhaK [Haloquadratum walsbyi]CCC40799.1 dihydroxyacetone kinase subunit DhaK [Haloquadratum walsbyi C23]